MALRWLLPVADVLQMIMILAAFLFFSVIIFAPNIGTYVDP